MTDQRQVEIGKARSVAREIRRRIVASRWAPDCRLPTHLELRNEFGIGPGTLQQAMDLLTREGFIESRGRNGTFVARHPPHLFQYGFLFPLLPEGVSELWSWSSYWAALASESRIMSETGPHRLTLYYGLQSEAATEDQRRLEADISSGRLAGLIATAPDMLRVPWIESIRAAHPIESVTIGHESATPIIPGVGCIYAERREWFETALDWLAKRGRRRLAVLSLLQDNPRKIVGLQSMIAERNMTLRDEFILGFDAHWQRQTVGPAVKLLMLLPPAIRPDAILITDDNLTWSASEALMDSGVRVGEDLDGVAHCNWPYLTPCHSRIRRLGYSVREVLSLCVQAIEQQRAGQIASARKYSTAFYEPDSAQIPNFAARAVGSPFGNGRFSHESFTG